MTTTTTTCGAALAGLLEERGVDVVFGIPGVHTLEIYRGLAASGIRHVVPRHEQGAGFMADGYGRVADRPGVCVVISGPGVTNVLTPLGQARHDARGLLVLSGSVRRSARGRRLGVIHDLPDQLAVTRPIARYATTVETPADLEPALAAAWAAMEGADGLPGPAHVAIPLDVLGEPAAAPASPAAATARREPAAADVQRAAELLAGAARPAIVLGGGARRAGDAAVRLADRLAAPLGLTINAKGAVDPRHPLVVASRMTFAPADRLFLDADVVLAVGTQLSELDWWALDAPFAPAGALIRVDLDPDAMAAGPEPAVSIVADAERTLAGLADAVASREVRTDGSGRDRVAAALRDLQLPDEIAVHLPLVRALDEALPADRIVAVDSTQPGYTSNHVLDVERPGSWLSPIGYGCLGCALPMAVGAKLAAPERAVLALAGDGGVLFTIQELATARDLALPLPLVVWNNDGYGEIRDSMAATGIPPLGTDASAADFVRIAEGFGCRGVRAQTVDHVAELVREALAADRPTLIEAGPWTAGAGG
jgi:acetolactate synthase I/II/III large subunit